MKGIACIGYNVAHIRNLRGRVIKIYAVEDSNADRFFFSRTIDRINKGDTVRFFISKDDLDGAIEEFGPPDLFVFDLDVAGCDGMDLIEAYSCSDSERLPIVVYTGRDSDVTRLEALEKGATRYVVKASDPRTETQVIRHFLDSARQFAT